MGITAQDLTGQQFGKLLVLGWTGKRNKQNIWDCVCDCGEHRDVTTYDLTHGRVTRCVKCRWENSHPTGPKNKATRERVTPRCRYNYEITCERKYCINCGWNPAVTEERREKYGARHLRQPQGHESLCT